MTTTAINTRTRTIDNPDFLAPEQMEAARKVCPAPPPDETWFSIYLGDRKAMLETMRANLAADIAAGYDPDGAGIQRQRKAIEDFRAAVSEILAMLYMVCEEDKENWCYFELLERGAISA